MCGLSPDADGRRASRLERGKQHGGLARNMQRSSNTPSLKGLFCGKFICDLPKHRHVAGGPRYTLLAALGQR